MYKMGRCNLSYGRCILSFGRYILLWGRCILSWLPKLVDATAGTLVFCQTVQTDKKSANLVTLSLSQNHVIIYVKSQNP